MHCLICHKPLTAASSIAEGVGPECAAKARRQAASIEAGKACERTISDMPLLTLGRRLLEKERLECLFVSRQQAVPLKLQKELQAARAAYAKRVEFLSEQGLLTIPEPVFELRPEANPVATSAHSRRGRAVSSEPHRTPCFG